MRMPAGAWSPGSLGASKLSRARGQPQGPLDRPANATASSARWGRRWTFGAPPASTARALTPAAVRFNRRWPDPCWTDTSEARPDDDQPRRPHLPGGLQLPALLARRQDHAADRVRLEERAMCAEDRWSVSPAMTRSASTSATLRPRPGACGRRRWVVRCSLTRPAVRTARSTRALTVDGLSTIAEPGVRASRLFAPAS